MDTIIYDINQRISNLQFKKQHFQKYFERCPTLCEIQIQACDRVILQLKKEKNGNSTTNKDTNTNSKHSMDRNYSPRILNNLKTRREEGDKN